MIFMFNDAGKSSSKKAACNEGDEEEKLKSLPFCARKKIENESKKEVEEVYELFASCEL